MKIAIAASGKWLESLLDEHTGRAHFFVVYETENESFEVIDNWNSVECIHWAGPRTVKRLVDTGAIDALIVRHIGPAAFRMFSEARVDVFYAPELTVADAIKRQRQGELPLAQAPNCHGHQHAAP